MVEGSEPALETEPAHLLAAVREFFWPLGDKARAHASPAASCLTPSRVARAGEAPRATTWPRKPPCTPARPTLVHSLLRSHAGAR